VQQGFVGNPRSKQTGGQQGLQGSGFGQHSLVGHGFGLHSLGGHGGGQGFGHFGFGQQSTFGCGQSGGGPQCSLASTPCISSIVAAAKIQCFITLHR